jgi:hypothetical protein
MSLAMDRHKTPPSGFGLRDILFLVVAAAVICLFAALVMLAD